jgi:diaminopimelate decarboxylase
MDHFAYRDGLLHAEAVPVPAIAAAVGTPAYVYSAATLTRHYRVMEEALRGLDARISYAMKANSNLAVLRLLARLGAGMDTVSMGEIARALRASVPGSRIVFSGVGKTAEEMRFALAHGIRQFNVESAPELQALDAVARDMGLRAPVCLRVNPDVDAVTHAKITTGRTENKFGIPFAEARALFAREADFPGTVFLGLDVHIGSQLTALAPFEAAFSRVAALARELRAAGHRIERLDLGGGLGVPYSASNAPPPLPFDYGDVIRRTVGDLGCEIEVEPGRLIVGNAGILLARVIYVKPGEGRTFLIVDAAMNDLIRPAMYEAHHDLVPVAEPPPGAPLAPVDIVGPVCETGDTFARARRLPPLAAGDLVAFRTAGAYGAVMSSEYNSRPLVPEVLVHGDHFDVVRRRPSIEEMLNRDTIPSWLA